MSIRNFRKISKKKLTPTNLIFKTYNGQTIKPLGIVNVSVKYKDQEHNLDLYIVKEDVDTIFGREWIRKINIDWVSIKSVQNSSDFLPFKDRFNALLKKYEKLFDNSSIGEIKNYECKLELKSDAQPVFCRPRPVPFALKTRVEREINRLEQEGIIEKTSISDWATPVVPIVKTDGSIRLCSDYSVTLNKNLKVQQHPLPKIEEIFSSLSGGKIFSRIDFSQAYLQMKMDTDSQKLLTINTHKGLYTCKRLMYGINAAPAIWQKYIEGVFKDLEGVAVFYDDARIAAPDYDTHFQRLEAFLQRCLEHGLRINKNKSVFFQNEIQFLGFKLNAQGLSKTNEKISAIMETKTPQNVQDIQSFMGLVNFYGRFSKDIATLAHPLHNLTKKDVPWKWDKACEKAFQDIKKEICSDRVLAHYDPDLPLLLSTDASPVGLGAVLSHKFPDGTEHPIAFASRTLSPTEQNYSQIDKEALGIVWAVKKFYLCLKGRRFTLITDHKPLVAIFSCKKGLPILSATRLLHYALVLQAYQFDIVYRCSKEHGNADFLSRLPKKSENLELKDDISIFQISQIGTLPVNANNLAKATETDEELAPILRILKYGGNLKRKEVVYSLQDGCIMYGQRVCVPKIYQKKVLEELHQGHLGIVKMKAIARSYVYWKNIDQDIEYLTKSCMDCAKYKEDPRKAKVHHWEYPSSPWERIHIDFAGPIFEHMFLLIVDAHSKWLEVYPMKKTTTSKTIECLRDCFARFGLPVVLVSDNGPQLTSSEFKTFLRNNGIQHKTCAPFKPSSNGQAERYVFTLKQSLRAMSNYPGNIKQKLDTFLMQYRKAPNMTTSQTPAMLFLKREIRTLIDLLRPNLKHEVENKVRNDICFKDRFFNVGDLVAVRNYRQGDCRWRFGRVVSRDGQLHYTVNVNGQLWRRHIDQIRDSAVESKEPDYLPRFCAPKFPTPQPKRDVLAQTDLPPGDEPTKSAGSYPDEATNTRSSPVVSTPPKPIVSHEKPSTEPAQPPGQSQTFRRSTRIRKPPQRLNL